LTRERIRQIEAKTLTKLTSYRDAERLRGFLD
jgi:DNA-directed RNA polymerase sigma subunit (sigma70/sigma32)